ncbi:MAG: hypothetical protein IJP68_07235 [Selenomonadaceae bacterium]|nr:hypothetical protein [Selenomonadaceae bacterium]MBR0061260.1 hypothetical protein [Selenomonadaceae bacterium]
MVKVSIQVTSLDANDKKLTDKIAYVNPTATNEQLVEFAEMLIAMTDNTYHATTKITEEDL